ncbi:MAG: alpha/beta-type small acid-soluble spore protein [Clostridia bacterium]|nr:alpha/beta-type small acid-soluble spore protein [Clostridia bacterium]
MSNKSIEVPAAKQALDQMKYEVANQIGVTLDKSYNGNISSKDAGRIGGSMTKKLVEMAENNMSNK